jgi:hypothetical protein
LQHTYWLVQGLALAVRKHGAAKIIVQLTETLQVIVEVVDQDEPELVTEWEQALPDLLVELRDLDVFISGQVEEVEHGRHREELRREMAGRDRLPVIQEILHSGLIRIRHAARTGDTDTADLVAEVLHDLPAAIDSEEAWRRWCWLALTLGVEAANDDLKPLMVRWQTLAATTETEVPF